MSTATELTRISNAKAAIRTSIENKGVTVPSSDLIDTYAGYIDQIQTGGGGDPEKDFFFYDYDGTELYSYTKDELNALTALPPGPVHTDLPTAVVFSKWNWTLADLKLEDRMNIGALYEPSDGKNYYEVIFDVETMAAYYNLSGATGTVSWGDGTSSSIPELGYDYPHTFAPGRYWISSASLGYVCDAVGQGAPISCSAPVRAFISPQSLSARPSFFNMIKLSSQVYAFGFPDGVGANDYGRSWLTPSLKILIYPPLPNSEYVYFSSITNFLLQLYNLETVCFPKYTSLQGDRSNDFYSTKVDKVLLSKHAGIIQQGCAGSSYLKEIRFWKFIGTSSSNRINAYCSPEIWSEEVEEGTNSQIQGYSLKKIKIGSGVTTLPNNIFQNCNFLESIELPAGITAFGSSCFRYDYNLKTITIPSTVTSIASSCFNSCISLTELNLPPLLTTLGGNAFQYDSSLRQITIPASVTDIGGSCFSQCKSLREVHMLGAVPPLLGSNVFNSSPIGTPGFGKIYVPYSADHAVLEAYKTDTNWSTYASNIYEEPQA